jgi:ABC-type transport system involved in cytochrome c biogenesis permease subunit
LAGVAGVAWAGEPGKLDWDAWERMPVLHEGRLKPLDTFARQIVEQICGRRSLFEECCYGRQGRRLSLAYANPAGRSDGPEWAAARALLPDDQPRVFAPAELLFSWLAEPEKWERVPFLRAEHEKLRQELFDLPTQDDKGHALRYVSPWQVSESTKFQRRLSELSRLQDHAAAEGKEFQPAGMDEKVSQLYQAYALYRMLTYHPSQPTAANNRFTSQLRRTIETWRDLEPAAGMVGRLDGQGAMKKRLAEIADSAGALAGLFHRDGENQASPEKLEPKLAAIRDAARALADQFRAYTERLLKDAPPGLDSGDLEKVQSQMRTLSARCGELSRQANQALLAIYDNGQTLRLVPALDPAALENNRDEHDDAQPWLSLQALRFGSPAVVGGYPQGELGSARTAFQTLAAAYAEHGAADRPARFSAAVAEFARSVRVLGESATRLRESLPIRNRDPDLMAATAYPPHGATDAELAYNHTDPFFWSWLLSLLAMLSLGLAFGAVRRPLAWLGLGLLLAAQLATAAGLGFRWYVTGLVPVTNMFETVVFVSLVVSALGTCFAAAPLFRPGLSTAWRMTALPHGRREEEPAHTAANWLLLLPRLALALGIFWVLTRVPYGASGHPVFGLLPKTDVGSSWPTPNSLLTWAVGLCVLGTAAWYLPRAGLTAALGLLLVPYRWAREGLRGAAEQVLARKPFALVGAGVAFLAAVLAYYAPAPVFIRDISPVRPILRDNFWLLIHVLTIAASYGAGGLAWGLGNIALGHYLFGRYRRPAADGPVAAGLPTEPLTVVAGLPTEPLTPTVGLRPEGDLRSHVSAGSGDPRRTAEPPEATAALATFIYQATQVAVLLLIAGTILGALWADVAWGRFWGWDSKEVAALITALVYLVILHGRYTGWFGNFGLAVGSVCGATAIVAAWYGVNYVFGSGLHSYGTGAGGQLQVGLIVACDWLFMSAAAVRYAWEMRRGG